MDTTKLKKAIDTLKASGVAHSDSLYFTEEIDSKLREAIEKWYAPIPQNEEILLFTNKIGKSFFGYFRTGICITNAALYCRLQADTFLSSLTLNRSRKIIPLTEINTISIGEHDHCYGTSYEGHQLIINGKVVGLIRMGTSIEYDEDMITELTEIFNALNK